MDILQATMAGIMIAREIRQLYEATKDISEEQLATLIAANLVRLDSTIATIKAELKRYGVEVK